MGHLVELINEHGYAVVLAAVLVEQMGLPVPAFPVLIVAGALVAEGTLSAPVVLALAIAAALAGDLLWFQLGRRYGRSVLATMCRLSWTPDGCAVTATGAFRRFGLKSLLVARFVPGLAAAAPSMAGLSGHRRMHFAAYDAAGGALWAGAAVATGYVFHREVDALLAALHGIGTGALVALAAIAVVAFAVAVLRQRARRERPSCTQC